MRVATYTAVTPPERRKYLRDAFAAGDIQALVAIRCLDEGVDIPETRTAFLLASAADPRQYVQRRGRVLRRAPGKGKADVHDFLVAPPRTHQDPASPFYNTTRSLFGRELKRAGEFAALAENGPEALGRLLPLRDRLGLLAVGIEDDMNDVTD
jgi:superfamily II DNA or RNA helicase